MFVRIKLMKDVKLLNSYNKSVIDFRSNQHYKKFTQKHDLDLDYGCFFKTFPCLLLLSAQSIVRLLLRIFLSKLLRLVLRLPLRLLFLIRLLLRLLLRFLLRAVAYVVS